MGFHVKHKFDGLKELLATTRGLKSNISKRILKKATTKASQSVRDAAKSNLASSKRTGTLRKSMSFKVKVYKNGTVIGIIGPRKGSKQVINGRNIDPTHYAHLVELGRKPVVAKSAKMLSDGTIIYGRRVARAEAKPFLRMALEDNKSKVVAIMSREIKAGLAKYGGKS